MVDSPRITPIRRFQQAERQARLARALRDNLRRRKEQAREQAELTERTPADQRQARRRGDEPPS